MEVSGFLRGRIWGSAMLFSVVFVVTFPVAESKKNMTLINIVSTVCQNTAHFTRQDLMENPSEWFLNEREREFNSLNMSQNNNLTGEDV